VAKGNPRTLLKSPFKFSRYGKSGLWFPAGEWQVSGWPTLYLIDHQGIIRKRWGPALVH
jgi:hypothetical protein